MRKTPDEFGSDWLDWFIIGAVAGILVSIVAWWLLYIISILALIVFFYLLYIFVRDNGGKDIYDLFCGGGGIDGDDSDSDSDDDTQD